MEPTCTEKLLSVINNSDASVDESQCSDASVCILKWVLELRDGRRVAVPIQISLPPRDVVDSVDDSNQLAMVPGVSLESKEIILGQEKGDDVVVEDWVSNVYSEDAFQYTEGPLLPLTI
nr:hypothetical protein CFP56_18917 [Quercus suber]